MEEERRIKEEIDRKNIWEAEIKKEKELKEARRIKKEKKRQLEEERKKREEEKANEMPDLSTLTKALPKSIGRG